MADTHPTQTAQAAPPDAPLPESRPHPASDRAAAKRRP